ncbi:MAG TPA: glycosyltransferase, partial [Candidatus Acidoferrum sp.]|nr:glycosyltransferase [Candidatus Acidoferrum sp.]
MIAVAQQAQTQAQKSWGPQALEEIRHARREFQDANATQRDKWIRSNEYFYDCLKRVLQLIVEPGKRVLHVRCETGHLLAAVVPECGIGVEIGQVMVDYAAGQHPNLQFVKGDPEDLELSEKFDYILFDHIFDTVDILRAFERLHQHCTSETLVVVINYNHLWQPVLQFASKIGLRSKFVEPNWISENDIRGFLRLAGFRPVRKHRFLLFPKWLPLFSSLMNKFIARLPGIRRLCLMQVMVARPLPEPVDERDVTVSVIVPCRNEKGNIQPAVERIPAMGGQSEILFCDDKSTDGTADEVRRMQALYPDKGIRVIDGPGICKAENVWTGFRAARGDVLMILDADLAVMPEELPMFLRALTGRRGDFVNGSRLIYPMQQEAMKFANEMGNKFFGVMFSFLLDQRIKDTLCGTKVLWR